MRKEFESNFSPIKRESEHKVTHRHTDTHGYTQNEQKARKTITAKKKKRRKTAAEFLFFFFWNTAGFHVFLFLSFFLSRMSSPRLLFALVLSLVTFFTLIHSSSPTVQALVSSSSCIVRVSPTTGIKQTNSNSNCSEIVCSWNQALEWCARNRSDSSAWSLFLEPGMFLFDEGSDSPPLPMQIPPGIVFFFRNKRLPTPALF